MSSEPKVTGLSPMTGPPGSKITVRGENLGYSSEDIIKLTINGADCLPYLEWKSSKKIITRCSKELGHGEVIVTTNSGGIGTCDVQFNCYEETIGLIDESAVWVEEVDKGAIERDKSNAASSVEEYSLDISSTRFKPHLYILQNCQESSLQELEQLAKQHRVELASKSDTKVASNSSNQAALLKSNLSTIMECLQILEHLSKVVNTSKESSIDNAVKIIKESLAKTHEIFDPLLDQRDLVQSIESAMQVFRQNETLFNLPSAIETSIKTRSYDDVVKEVSAVISRLKTIDLDRSLTEKIQVDVTSKVDGLKSTIETHLLQICQSSSEQRNIDEVRKLISHLNKLGEPIKYDMWSVMKEMSTSLVETMSEKYGYYLKLTTDDSATAALSSMVSTTSKSREKPPTVVEFVDTAIWLFNNTYYDLMGLGQSYFDYKDELSCRDSDVVRATKLSDYEETMVIKPIEHLTSLLRRALVPESAKLQSSSDWPLNYTPSFVDWIKHTLQSVINCHIHLTKVNLPAVTRIPIEDLKEFLFELRVRFMRVLFENATKLNKNLHEDWSVEVDDTHGGITKLPYLFESNVIETLRFANEIIFKSNIAGDKSILKRVDVQAAMKELAHSLVNSFIDSLENALIDSNQSPSETSRILIATKDSKRVPSEYMSRLLITISNCMLTQEKIFVRLQSEFEKMEGIKMDRVFKVCSKKYSDYIAKTTDKYCRIKCAELSKIAKNSDGGIEDLQINLMMANSQVFLIAPQLVNCIMTQIVNQIQKDRE